jgi:hypothetical protein
MGPRAVASAVDGVEPGASVADRVRGGRGRGGRGWPRRGGWRLHGRDKHERDGVEKCERRDKVEERFKIKNNFLE